MTAEGCFNEAITVFQASSKDKALLATALSEWSQEGHRWDSRLDAVDGAMPDTF
jgi:hypothetical protein